MNLNQVTLPARNLDQTSRFYRELGFTQIVDSPRYARFECPEGGASFSLSLEEGEFENGAVIYFEHERLDEWVAELEERGIAFDERPKNRSWLWREAVLHDPSGNRIKLYQAGENRLSPPWRVEIRR